MIVIYDAENKASLFIASQKNQHQKTGADGYDINYERVAIVGYPLYIDSLLTVTFVDNISILVTIDFYIL